MFQRMHRASRFSHGNCVECCGGCGNLSAPTPSMNVKHYPSVIVSLLLVVLIGSASAINRSFLVGCASGGGHLKANGQPLGYDCMVEVGAFTVGFDPESGNRALWKANWHPIKRVNYFTDTQDFTAAVLIENNNVPYTTTNKIWVWVFDSSGNWNLFSNTSWLWPNTNFPDFGLPTTYSPSTANIVRAGSVSNSNPELTCELVTDAAGPGVTFPQWAELKLPEGFRTKGGDYDGDGQSNLMEYALGSDATDRRNFSAAVQVRDYSGQSYLSAKVNRGYTTGVNYTVQWSNTLTGWQSTGLTTLVNSNALLEVRDAAITGTDPRRFMRVHIYCPD